MLSNRLQLNTAKTKALWCASSRQQHMHPKCPAAAPTTSNQERRSATSRYTSTVTYPWKPMCRGPFPAALRPCVTFAASVAPSLSAFWCSSSQRLFCLVSVKFNGITTRLVNRLQSVLNVASRVACNSHKYDCISPLLRDLHWLRVPERIKFRLAVLVFHCRNQTAPEYLTRELQWAVYDEPRRRLRSASSQRLIVRRTRLRTAGDRVFYGTAYQPTLSLHSRWQLSRNG